MIFVTVGTHEQPFDRLLREVDRLASEAAVGPVFCQTGYSTYEPRHAAWAPMVGFHDMQERLVSASVVVCHGGPGTIAPVLAAGRPLVLVPRQRRYGEHVDDHQVAFCRRLGRSRGVPVVEDIAELEEAIRLADRAPDAQGTTTPAGHEAIERLGRLIDGLLYARAPAPAATPDSTSAS